MNKFVENVLETYKHNEINFDKLLYWHIAFGVVVSDADSFALCYYSDSESPEQACERHHADTLFVTIHSGDMRKALRKFRDDFEFIAFQRDFKNSPRIRVYNMNQFYSKLK